MSVFFYQTLKNRHLISRYIEKSKIVHKGQLQYYLISRLRQLHFMF